MKTVIFIAVVCDGIWIKITDLTVQTWMKKKISEYKIGGGWSKVVDIGIFEGQKVVIQRLSTSKIPESSRDYRYVLLMKNLQMRDQLDHPSLINMLGYCLRNIKGESHNNSSY